MEQLKHNQHLIFFVVDLNREFSADLVKLAIHKFNASKHFRFVGEKTIPQFNIHQYNNTMNIFCVIVIGGNETLLRAYEYFQFQDSPPILTIANGCAPILYNYSGCQLESLLELVIPQLETNKCQIQNCMKLEICKKEDVVAQATCQIEIHRGITQSVVKLNLYLGSKCEVEPFLIGKFVGDGLLFSTPMGSFCKSMTLNSPLMHKEMENILITPICPLSMKFRSLCLPATFQLLLEVDPTSRANCIAYVDRSPNHIDLEPGEKIIIRMSQHKTKLIYNILEPYEESYIKGLKEILSWGETEVEREKFHLTHKFTSFEEENLE